MFDFSKTPMIQSLHFVASPYNHFDLSNNRMDTTSPEMLEELPLLEENAF